jgi:ribosomal protein S12 methylthiotransferase
MESGPQHFSLTGEELAGKINSLTFSIVTLGCAKNLVDSEVLLGMMRSHGLTSTSDPEEADVVVVNTCGFIESAKRESIDAIFQTLKRKQEGKLKKLYISGCLSQRYRQELQREIPQVDGFFGVAEMEKIIRELTGQSNGAWEDSGVTERMLTTPSHFAYLKISEGCDNPCSFCAIPLIRGAHVSRPFDEVVSEARKLAECGVKELIIIAQDTTYYGIDLYGERRLPALLTELSRLEGVEWVRIMYTYPAQFPISLLNVISENEKICKYIDLPIQHISDRVLRSMRRGITRRATERLIDKIRSVIPGVALRTTLIVGYPNESEREYTELLDFVRDAKFDRLGVFAYSDEDGTDAAHLGDPSSPEVKEERRAQIMEIQKEISLERNEALIGKTLKVIVDSAEDGMFIGRTEKDAPEVDNEVFVRKDLMKSDGGLLEIGNFYDLRVVDAVEYDLYAVPFGQLCATL